MGHPLGPREHTQETEMSNRKLQTQLMGASAMVTEMALFVLAAAFAGNWADEQLQTSPLLLILGIVGGFTLGMTRLLKTLQRLDRDHERPPPDDSP